LFRRCVRSQEKQAFSGWDFSYLDGRWESESLPWDYKEIILNYLDKSMNLLDMGTGGGEFLLTLNHPFDKTSVTEGYQPNILICKSKLEPLGIKVYPVNDNLLVNVPDKKFDIVINRHESYNELELKRVLKEDGIFITQQVGAYNNKDLATFFDPNHTDQAPEMTLNKSISRLEKAGFKIVFKNEYYPTLKFYDLGAIAYLAKIIKWEFLDFSVEKTFDKFLILKNELDKNGYVKSTEHRFIIVANKK
jgi:hypothetical protein